MASHSSTEIKVGLVSIAAIILLILGITLGRGLSVSVSTQTIKFRFPNSGGIQLSSPVVVNGVKRGTVTYVKNDRGTVLVEASIDDVSDLFKDASAQITTLEITGGKKLEINPGNGPGKLDINTEIPGFTAADLSELVSTGGALFKDVQSLILKLDTISTGLNKILGKEKNIRQLEAIINNAAEFITSAKELLENNRSDINVAMKNLRVISGDVKDLVKKNEPRLDSLLTNLDNTLNSARSAVGKADNSLANVDLLIKDLKDITKEIKTGDGIVTKLLFDKNTTIKLDSTLTNLSEFLSLIKYHGINVNVRLGTRP